MSWPIVKLGDVFTIARGGSPRPIDDYITDAPSGVNWIMIGDTKDGSKYIEKTAKKIRPEGIKKSRMVYPGDFLLTNSMSFGRPYILKTEGCIHDGWLVLSPKSDQIHTDYFYHYLGSFEVKNRLAAKAAGAVVKNLNSDIVRQLEIPLPPLVEQQRIAAILDKADALRRKRQQAIDLADQFLRSVFLEMFGDPVTNPKRWDMVPMSEFSSFENGDRSSNYPSGEDIVDAGVLFLSTKNILQDELSLKTCQYITKEKFDSLSRGKARQGDLIITLRGTLGACCIFESEHDTAFINAQMMIIRPNRNATNVYLHDLITSRAIKAQLQKIGQGAAVPQLTAQQLKDLKLPLPPVELQNRYECVRQSVLNMVGKMKGSSGEGLFESVSQQAFRGEL